MPHSAYNGYSPVDNFELAGLDQRLHNLADRVCGCNATPGGNVAKGGRRAAVRGAVVHDKPVHFAGVVLLHLGARSAPARFAFGGGVQAHNLTDTAFAQVELFGDLRRRKTALVQAGNGFVSGGFT